MCELGKFDVHSVFFHRNFTLVILGEKNSSEDDLDVDFTSLPLWATAATAAFIQINNPFISGNGQTLKFALICVVQILCSYVFVQCKLMNMYNVMVVWVGYILTHCYTFTKVMEYWDFSGSWMIKLNQNPCTIFLTISEKHVHFDRPWNLNKKFQVLVLDLPKRLCIDISRSCSQWVEHLYYVLIYKCKPVCGGLPHRYKHIATCTRRHTAWHIARYINAVYMLYRCIAGYWLLIQYPREIADFSGNEINNLFFSKYLTETILNFLQNAVYAWRICWRYEYFWKLFTVLIWYDWFVYTWFTFPGRIA